MGLSPEAIQILDAVRQGATVKAHRALDGTKIHKVHPLQAEPFAVSEAAVRALENRGWLRSNMKFPVATYLLTETGRKATIPTPPLLRWPQWLYRWVSTWVRQ